MSDQFPPPTGAPLDGPVGPPADPPSAEVPPVADPAAGAAVPPYGTPAYSAPTSAGAGAAASYDAPPLGQPELLAGGTVLPAAEPPRRTVRGRTVVAAALGVLLVLLAGGAAYGWSFLNRADVKLARAFDTTKSSAGDLTVTVEGIDGVGSTDAPKVRYAWTADGTVQVQLTMASSSDPAFDLISSGTHVILRVDASAVPEGASALQQLRTIADTLGPDGAALAALADGKPVGMAIGPGSRFQKLLDEASASASQSPDSAVVSQQVAAAMDAIVTSIRDNVTVTAAGSDQYGDRSTVSLPLKPVVSQALDQLKKTVPALGESGPSSADLAEIEGKTVHADVWVSDGRIVRISIPVDQFGDGAKGAVVVTFGTSGVQQPTEQVTEVSDALLDKLLGGLPALGGGDSLTG